MITVLKGEHRLHFHGGYLVAVTYKQYGVEFTLAKGAKFNTLPTAEQRWFNERLPRALRKERRGLSSWDFEAIIQRASRGEDICGALQYPEDALATLGLLLGVELPARQEDAPEAWCKLAERLTYALNYGGLVPRQHNTFWVWDWS